MHATTTTLVFLKAVTVLWMWKFFTHCTNWHCITQLWLLKGAIPPCAPCPISFCPPSRSPPCACCPPTPRPCFGSLESVLSPWTAASVFCANDDSETLRDYEPPTACFKNTKHRLISTLNFSEFINDWILMSCTEQDHLSTTVILNLFSYVKLCSSEICKISPNMNVQHAHTHFLRISPFNTALAKKKKKWKKHISPVTFNLQNVVSPACK